ncbi:MAG: hypothetical protein F6K19_23970 [Cyanothece sp. SIO1E1]|nr:hypothetical protein [Cyanothece sp. SIO1E1]
MQQALEPPHLLRVNLQNPITHEEINRLVQAISTTVQHSALLINFGEHNFASIAVLRHCKNELMRVAEQLEQFDKIAFITPPSYQGVNQERLRYFQEEVQALSWLNKT